MKVKIGAVLALMLLLTACSPATEALGNPEQTTTTPVSTPEPAADPNLDAMMAVLLETYDESRILSAAVDGSKAQAEILCGNSIDATIPDDWADTRATAEAVGTDLISGDITTSVLCLLDSDDNILLTVIDGGISYDAFDEESHVAYNAATISLAEFNEITTGMSYDEVVAIVGGPGEILSQADLGLGTQAATVMYSWAGEGSVGANATVMFQGGEVISKAQAGLQ